MYRNFTKLGIFNTNNIKKIIENFTEEDWLEWDFRQKVHHVHRKTLTVPIMFNEDITQPSKKFKHYSLFSEEVDKINFYFKNRYKSGYLNRLIIVNLTAGSQVDMHTDAALELRKSFRHHIVVKTNRDVIFQIENERLNMKEREVWKIENDRVHGVFNNSDEDRIHLIADWDFE